MSGQGETAAGRLWLAHVEFTMVVVASDPDDALRVAAAHVQGAIPDDGFNGVERAVAIDRVDDLPPEWRDSSVPWGNVRGDDRSCVERLTGVPAKKRPTAAEKREALAAAAPDLLAECRSYLELLTADGAECTCAAGDPCPLCRLERALARAEGRDTTPTGAKP